MANRRPQSPPRQPRHLYFLAALWALALLAYADSFQTGLIFDSQRVILADPRLQAATSENIGLIATHDYYFGTGSGALYRPLTSLTYLWNYAILGNGPNPAGYHWINFAIHAANIALVYALGLLLFAELWPAFAMAALWAVHPVLTESVTNVVGRADLLAALGVLAGLLCYTRVPNSKRWLGPLAAASVVAVFSKESGVVLLAVMLLYDVAFPGWKTRAVGYVAALLPMAIFFVVRHSVLSHAPSLLISFGDNPLLGVDFWTARLTAIKVLGHYLWLLIWPAALSPDYSYHQIPVGASVVWLALWMAVAAAALVSFRRARPLFFCILFFLLTIAPVANIFMLVGSIMAERFLYLPAIGFAGVIVWVARALPGVAPKQLLTALATVCLLFAGRTYARNGDWQDERTLWTSAAAVVPDSYKVHHNLAQIALAQAQPDLATATREVERAIAILAPLPDERSLSSVYATAGLCYYMANNFDRALVTLEHARKIDRTWSEIQTARNRADGKSLPPVGTPALYFDLGRVYTALNRPADARDALLTGRAIDPQPAFFLQLSQSYQALGQTGPAEISLLEGLTIDSNQQDLMQEAVRLYQLSAPGSCAVANGTLNLACPAVRADFCTATANVAAIFTQLGDTESAAAVRQKCR